MQVPPQPYKAHPTSVWNVQVPLDQQVTCKAHPLAEEKQGTIRLLNLVCL
jgi:hypothetical protein